MANVNLEIEQIWKKLIQQVGIKNLKLIINDAAYLPNMDQPHDFQIIVEEFLKSLSR